MYDEHHWALIDSDRSRLVRAATRLLGPAEAEDAVQDAYLRALVADTQAPFVAQAWLLTVVRNLAIDSLRRRDWMQQWLAGMDAGDTASQSAEMDAALAQEAAKALRLLAAQLAPEDGAALLLHEIFEVTHAEIAEASGRSEAASRQQLRRALLRLRQAAGPGTDTETTAEQETVFRLYLQSLQLRDPHTLWAMLRRPPISALASLSTLAAEALSAPPVTTCGVLQVGGQLGLVLTLDGVRLCVVPLGVRAECEREAALL
ncbi:RNA polymerase sigma-70 factor, ECF subfamily [Rhodoferax sp. OV413]|uniref:RNA polymerase sigma factor n=1 Tax=Rhodoferax sp. OV413 TaxID=1855285 RepID=UPI00088AE2F7|nr:sigma-70 family RNA polymerase sigma factor [Rhodoferax sp. OV413]SDP67960.1 RNA polymerase sigma-70 factor, ECF subfamily [Rhodoferax sp. OV413]